MADPIGRYRLPDAGVWANFEQLGANHEWLRGDLIRQLDAIDPSSGMRAYDEVALQMDAMRAMGINIITFDLVTVGATYEPPDFPICGLAPDIGLLYPSPTALELTNLGRFFDLAASKGLKVILRLSNTHEDDLTGSGTWLDAILGVARAHDNVDLVSFDGDLNKIDTDGDGKPDVCGGHSEPRLFMGFQSAQAQYVRFAIQRGMAAGIPARKLSAEAIVATKVYFDQSPTTSFGVQDGHFWDPVLVEKQIFDSLGIPDSQRTYDLSFYEMTKCGDLKGCQDEAPAAWAEEVADRVAQIVGTGNGARVLAVEMGVNPQWDPSWQSDRALEDLTNIMEAHGFSGGAFWEWVAPNPGLQSDPLHELDVKKLGTSFVYNPVKKIIEDMGGFHLIAVPNGSFEAGDAAPAQWIVEAPRRRAVKPASGGSLGSVSRIKIDADVPTRGSYAMRLTTGESSVAAVSQPIPITPGTTYTTAMALRFAWSGDPNANVYVAFDYFDANGRPLGSDVTRYFQENSTNGFETFVFHYTAPAGAQSVRIEIGAQRKGLPQPITLDVDAVR